MMSNSKLPISVTILTKNSQKYIEEVLDSLQHFHEVVVYDTGSNDSTIKIAKRFPNVTVYEKPFVGFGPTHNQASAVAKNEWILSVDSDEVMTPALAKEIENLTLDASCVYSFPRHNFYNGKMIKWCGWYPDRQIRLYNRKKTRFTDAQVHESIIADNMRHIALQGALKHYSYANLSDFLTKMQCYSDLFANENRCKKRASPWKAITHGFYAFFKSYIIKRGFLGGYEGFVISTYNANTAFYKYLKLYERSFPLSRVEECDGGRKRKQGD